MTERRNCPMRHENGNCLPHGGFCTAVTEEICKALHNAYEHGLQDAAHQHKSRVSEEESEQDYTDMFGQRMSRARRTRKTVPAGLLLAA